MCCSTALLPWPLADGCRLNNGCCCFPGKKSNLRNRSALFFSWLFCAAIRSTKKPSGKIESGSKSTMHEGTQLPNPENKNSCKRKNLPERSSLIILFLSKSLPLAQPGCHSYRAAICVAVKLEHHIIREEEAAFFGCVFKELVADRLWPEP